jgi:hypothetical protein
VNARSTASFRYPEGLRGNKIGLSADVALCPGHFLTNIGNSSKFKRFTVTRCPALSDCVGLFWQTLNQRVQGSSSCAPTTAFFGPLKSLRKSRLFVSSPEKFVARSFLIPSSSRRIAALAMRS